MLHFLKDIKEQNTEVIFKGDEFGLLNEHRTYIPSFGEGSIYVTSYDSWSIHHVQLKNCRQKSEVLEITTQSKCIIFNLDPTHTLEWVFSSNQRHKIQPQTGTFFNSINKKFTLDLSNTINILIIELKKNYFEQGLFNPSLKELIQSIFKQNDRLAFLLSKQLSNYIKEIQQSEKRGLCQLMFLNAKIFEVLSELTDDLEAVPTIDNILPHQEQLAQVKELIDSNLHKQYSITDLAKIVGINTSYLKRYFKEYYNETIFEYSTQKRIDRAKYLLENTDFPISTVAEQIGYQQGAHFSYAFKKNTGITPNQYRKEKLRILQ